MFLPSVNPSWEARTGALTVCACMMLGAAVAMVAAQPPVQKGPAVASSAEVPLLLSANKRCVFSPKPDYSLTADENDPVQLTDGIRHSGQIWVDRKTVGWAHVPLPTLTLDLGAVHAIGMVNYYAAGGCCGAYFPEATALLLSTDGQAYEIAALNAWPPGEQKDDGAHVRKFQIDARHKRARFVRLTFQPHKGFVMLDEVEVLGDRVTPQRLAEYQKSTTRPNWTLWEWVGVRPQLIELAGHGEQAREAIGSLDRRFADLDLDGGPAADGLLREALEMRASLAKAHFRREWMCWNTPPWDELLGSTFAAPDRKPTRSIDLHLWQNEYESAAVSIGNFAADARQFRVTIGPLPDAAGNKHDWSQRLWLREAMFVPTFRGPRAADPLPLIAGDRGVAGQIEIQAGAVRVLWLTLRAKDLPAGQYCATLDIRPVDNESDLHRVELKLRVDPLTMPGPNDVALTSEHYVQRWGWNLPAQIEDDLDRHYSNSRVFHPVCLPWPKVDATKTVLESVDFSAYDKALEETGAIRIHSVFWGGGGDGPPVLQQFDLESPAGQACFKQWIKAWSDHVAERGLGFDEFFFYPYDEEINETFILIARLIKEVDPRHHIVCNEVRSKGGATPEAITRIAPYIDIWCPNTHVYLPPVPTWVFGPENRRAFEDARRNHPGRLWIYGVSGGGADATPGSKHLAPGKYHRWLPWLAFREGATTAGFWCYAGTNNLWDDFDGRGPDYGVVYFANDAPAGVARNEVVIPSRRWEAWREGVEDYQYLFELREAIRMATEAGVVQSTLERANQVLQQCLEEVLGESVESAHYDRAREDLTKTILKLKLLVERP